MPEEAGAFSEAAEAMGAELRSAGHRVQTFPGPCGPRTPPRSTPAP
jgi:hypothetical protein